MDFFETHTVYIRMIDIQEGYIEMDSNKKFVRKYKKGYKKIFKSIFNNLVGDKESELPEYKYYYFHKERDTGILSIYNYHWQGGDLGPLLKKLNENVYRGAEHGYTFNKFKFVLKNDCKFEAIREYEEDGIGLQKFAFSHLKDQLECSYTSHASNEVAKLLPTFKVRESYGEYTVTEHYTRYNLLQKSDFTFKKK